MRADLEAETHLFHVERFGGLAVLLQLLGALVVVLAPVDDLAHRRCGVRGDFYQIKLALLGNLQSFLAAQNAELLAVFVDDAQLRRPNLFIQASVFGYVLSPLIIIGLKVPAL